MFTIVQVALPASALSDPYEILWDQPSAKAGDPILRALHDDLSVEVDEAGEGRLRRPWRAERFTRARSTLEWIAIA